MAITIVIDSTARQTCPLIMDVNERPMNKPGKAGITRVIAACHYTLKGLTAAWTNEAAFRQELVIFFLMIPLALWLGETAVQRALLIGSCLIVVIVELLNSAIEAVVDRIGPEHNELSGRAKDMGSAAVFVSASLVVIVWGLLTWQRFA